MRNRLWQSSIDLWKDCVQKNLSLTGGNLRRPRPVLNLGIAYARHKDYEQALRVFDLVLEITPYHHQAKYLRAVMLVRLNRCKEAIKDLKEVEFLYKNVLPRYPEKRPYVERFLNEQDLSLLLKECHE